MNWETVDMGTSRMRTPDGWLVRYTCGHGASLCYVPDKDKDWN